MKNFFQVDRRFSELTNEEREEPQRLIDRMFLPSTGRELSWDQLLDSERVLLLAEAGSGKTKEMAAQAERLKVEGKAAFFVPIEALAHGEEFRRYLEAGIGELERFDRWKDQEDEPGWFLLDAVDELKLTNGKLDSALREMARALGPGRDRARIIISSRPTDWKPVQDHETLLKWLPLSEPVQTIVETPAEEFQRRVLQRGRREKNVWEKDTSSPERFIVVALQPLDQGQIKAFAELSGVTDADEFLRELERREAMPFARRPLDLKGLIVTWEKSKCIGTRAEQHEVSVEESLKDDPDRPDRDAISLEKARDGAERLALAMLRTKTRTIRSLEPGAETDDSSALDPRAILRDWRDSEILALLRRGIFDPATYGRIRFHHRSVQEYLAAKRLKRLVAGGLGRRELSCLLFADTYGERVLIPSMRPVAAWLALDDANIAYEILRREPEVLLLEGDAQSLSHDVRGALINAYVTAYGGGMWRGLDMPVTEVRRLANPDLSDIIIDCWGKTRSNTEIADFLLKLVWLGQIGEAADIAFHALMDTKLPDYTRVVASKGLREIGRTDLQKAACADLLANPENWPARVVYSLSVDLYPAAISISDLETIVRRTLEPESNVTGGMSWMLFTLAEDLRPGSHEAIQLRQMIAKLVQEGIIVGDDWYHRPNNFAHLTAALVRLCAREVLGCGRPNDELLRCCAVGNFYNVDRLITGREEREKLKAWFESHLEYREKLFWLEHDLVEGGRSGTATVRMFSLNDALLTGPVRPDDWPWLFRRVKRKTDPRRGASFGLMLDALRYRASDPSDIVALRLAVADNSDFKQRLNDRTTPRPETETEREFACLEAEHKKIQVERVRKEQAANQSWVDWWETAQRDPKAAVTGEKRAQSMHVLLQWMSFRPSTEQRLTRQGWRDIRRLCGDVIGDGFEAALKDYWRRNKPPVWSRRSPGEYNKLYHSQAVALTALSVEAESDPAWATKLTKAHATRAAEWALLELNGLPEWFDALAHAQPQAVQKVLETEITVELADKAVRQHAHTFYALRYRGGLLGKLAAPIVRSAVLDWPKMPRKEASANILVANLDTALRLLSIAGALNAEVAAFAEARFSAAPGARDALIWLRSIFDYDFGRGIAAMKAGLKRTKPHQRGGTAIQWFTGLFSNEYNETSPTGIIGARPSQLGKFIELSFGAVTGEADQHYEGSLAQNMPDDAQTARRRLLSVLYATPGAEAHAEILRLAGKPVFADFADQMRLSARRRAASDSELSRLSPTGYRGWEELFERPPRNRDELFEVTLSRLDDILYDIHHHDFSERAALKDITEEPKMQPILTRKFEDTAQGQYVVSREEQVVDGKETDIRLAATASTDRSVIEIKIGDNNTIATLEERLENQLVKQYLRHHRCKVGIFLVTYAGRKKFTDQGKEVPFPQVIDRLAKKANVIEHAEEGRIRLAVVGLDLRGPEDIKPPKSKKHAGGGAAVARIKQVFAEGIAE